MKAKLAVAAVLVLVVALAIGATPMTSAAPVPMVLELQLSGAQEVPAHSTPMNVFARLTLDGLDASYALTVSGVDAGQVTAAHIHNGAPGINGPIIHPLATTGFLTASGKVTLSVDEYADLLRGNLYVNVHSLTFPNGDVRAQIIPPRLATLHQQQFDALNRGDVAGVMSFFADNAVFAVGGCAAAPCVGKAAIESEIRQEVATHVRAVALGVSVSGDTLSEFGEVTSDVVRAAGVQSLRFLYETSFAGDKIVSVTGRGDTSDAQTLAFARATQAASGASSSASACPANLSPVNAADPSIIVDQPLAGARVVSPVRISGRARVFEAVVSITIFDASGTAIASSTTLAVPASTVPSPYATSVPFAIAREQAGCIRVFEASAKDGSPVNVVQVPVTLGTISPPSTGDGGLIQQGWSSAWGEQVVVALGVLLLLGLKRFMRAAIDS